MNHFYALLFTLVTGLFFVIGFLITYFTKNNSRFVHFSISVAFGVIITLIVFELLPESIEYVSGTYRPPLTYLFILFFAGIGVFLLKILDHFIPDHDHGNSQESVNENLFHIGYVASIALILHNIIEGMAIYSSVSSGIELGTLVMLGVGLHNIPMGMVIASTLSKSKASKKKKTIFLVAVSLSTFIGGIIMNTLSFLISNLFLGVLLAITLGMLVYIAIFELLGEILETKEKRLAILGILLGVFIFLISTFFE